MTEANGDGEERRPEPGAPQSGISGEVLAQLQHALLAAVLGRRPLPGGERPVVLPDLQFVLGGDAVALAEENLVSPSAAEGLGRPVQVLSLEELRHQAERRGEFGYLRFGPAERDDRSIRLTLEARMAHPDPHEPQLGLSGLQARFVEVGGAWEISEEPAFFAT